ncbi:MAG: hypothetical protein LBH47_02390 [Christensenellaceae bacterium]|jgi:hypothetical protein|nr:hypothetical protein [Christensenellaceae bacterium]
MKNKSNPPPVEERRSRQRKFRFQLRGYVKRAKLLKIIEQRNNKFNGKKDVDDDEYNVDEKKM